MTSHSPRSLIPSVEEPCLKKIIKVYVYPYILKILLCLSSAAVFLFCALVKGCGRPLTTLDVAVFVQEMQYERHLLTLTDENKCRLTCLFCAGDHECVLYIRFN